MPYLILLIFIAVPIAEIAVFIRVGEIIGLGATILLVILTAIVGVALLKRQGVAVLAEARRTLDAGQLPVQSVIDGVCLLIAGAFLLTPGLITDTVGFLLLVPAFRRALAHWLIEKLRKGGHIDVTITGAPGRPRGDSGPGGSVGPVIEGDYTPIDEELRSSENGKGADRSPKRDSGSPWQRS